MYAFKLYRYTGLKRCAFKFYRHISLKEGYFIYKYQFDVYRKKNILLSLILLYKLSIYVYHKQNRTS